MNKENDHQDILNGFFPLKVMLFCLIKKIQVICFILFLTLIQQISVQMYRFFGSLNEMNS